MLNRTIAFVLTLLLWQGAITPAQSPQGAPRTLLIKAGRVLDVKTGAVLKAQGVLVEGGRIRQLGAWESVRALAPKDAPVIDLGAAMLLPGLIDCHSHLFAAQDGRTDTAAGLDEAGRLRLAEAMARETLEAGITTVRNLGGSGVKGDAVLRDRINAGEVPGPRLLAATRKLTPPGGQGSNLAPDIIARQYLIVEGVMAARSAVRAAIEAGANVIKVVIDVGPRVLTSEEVKALVQEAHRHGLKVAAHATTAKGTRVAAEAWVDSIEHASEIEDDTLRLMARRGIFLMPNDHPPETFQHIFQKDLERSAPADRADFEKFLADYRVKAPDRLQRAVRARVRIAAGADMVFLYPGKTRGQASLLVLEGLVWEGLSPLDAIRAATVNAAELIGWQDRVGTIARGRFADLIAVEGDPTKDIKVLQQVAFVMKEGVVVKNTLAVGKSSEGAK